MLIVSGASREENRRDLAHRLCRPRIPVRLIIQRSRLVLESLLWGEYWRPSRPFFEVDLRLVQRLNRLKRAWLNVLRHPADRLWQMHYCWRYFGLLHHTLRIARDEPRRPDPREAIRRIVGFEVFAVEAIGEPGFAGCTVTTRNPVFMLGQLAVDPTVPTPRHVPLLVPPGLNDAFYHYRQLLVSGTPAQSMLISPAVSLLERASSFTPIDRLARLVSERPDPYWKPRAKLLTRRVLAPLLHARREEHPNMTAAPLSILDLGAGTGHLVAKAWTYLGRMFSAALPPAAFHFVDSNPPAFGRSFGLTRDRAGVAHVEWTTGDYRTLVDDDRWLQKCGPLDWVFACRIFDNASNFLIENVDEGSGFWPTVECLPHRCLSPRCQPGGIRRLMVSPVRRQANGGTVLPQFSLRDYFAAIQVLQSSTLGDVCDDGAWPLPIRRFNPASLITPSGRSLLAQLMKVSRAIIIEDLDVEPEHLKQHRVQFGLAGTALVFCTRDGFSTEAKHYVLSSPTWAQHVRGERLW